MTITPCYERIARLEEERRNRPFCRIEGCEKRIYETSDRCFAHLSTQEIIDIFEPLDDADHVLDMLSFPQAALVSIAIGQRLVQAEKIRVDKEAEQRRLCQETKRREQDSVPYTLYRLHNSSGELLYVGISRSFPGRMKTHSREKEWWPEVADIKVEHLVGLSAAERAELEAIRTEGPRYNVMGKTPPKSNLPDPDELLTFHKASCLLSIPSCNLRTLVEWGLVKQELAPSPVNLPRVRRSEVERVAVEGLTWHDDYDAHELHQQSRIPEYIGVPEFLNFKILCGSLDDLYWMFIDSYEPPQHDLTRAELRARWDGMADLRPGSSVLERFGFPPEPSFVEDEDGVKMPKRWLAEVEECVRQFTLKYYQEMKTTTDKLGSFLTLSIRPGLDV